MQVFLISVLVGLASAQGPRQTCQEGPGEKVGFVYIGSKKTEQPCCAKQKDVVCEPDAWYFPTTTATSKADCANAGVSRSNGVEGKANIQKGNNGDRVSICAWFKACEFYNPKKECAKSQLGGSWRQDDGILSCGAGGCCKWEHHTLVTKEWNTWVQASTCPEGNSNHPNQVTGPYYMPGNDGVSVDICVKNPDGGEWTLYEGLQPINVQGAISDAKCLNGCCAF